MKAVAWLLALCAPGWLACSSAPVSADRGAQGGADMNGSGAPSSIAGAGGSESDGAGGQAPLGGAAGAPSGATAGEAAEGGMATAAPEGGAGGACDSEPVAVGTLASPALSEVSGIVASARNPGVYYVHNDSGDTARFFAIDEQGRTLAELALNGADAVDWEDIALGPGPGGGSFVYLGDIGDNEARVGGTPRASINVYRVAEPLILSDEAPEPLVVDWERLPLSYPTAAHDCEALLLDPKSSELLLVTKENDGKSSVFRASALAAAEAKQTLELVTQIEVGTTQAPGSSLITGGELSPMGDGILLRTYTSVFFWSRPSSASIVDAFAGAPRQLLAPDEEQGESITFTADGSSYLTVSEDEQAPVFRAQLCDL